MRFLIFILVILITSCGRKMPEKSIVYTKKAPEPVGPYSQGVVATGTFVFTAGQIAIDPETGKLIEGDIKAQTKQVLENIKAVLESAGTGLENVVKVTVYMKDLSEFSQMNEVYSEYFKESKPARTTVEVSNLPKGVKIEIDAIAVK